MAIFVVVGIDGTSEVMREVEASSEREAVRIAVAAGMTVTSVARAAPAMQRTVDLEIAEHGLRVDRSRQHGWHPGIAAVLSLVIPGAGQIYKQQVGQGLLWLVAAVIGYASCVVPGIVVHIISIVLAATQEPKR